MIPRREGSQGASGRDPGDHDRVRGNEGRSSVTLEEGLVALLAGAAAILLFVGLAQALDARPAGSSARSRRRSRVRPTTRPGPAAPAAKPATLELPPRAPHT